MIRSSIKCIARGVVACFMAMILVTPLSNFAAAPSGFGDDSQIKDDPFNIPKAEDGKQGEKILDVAKGVVNWVLGILGLIALIVLLYGGLLMVTAAGDTTQYEKGMKFLKGAAV